MLDGTTVRLVQIVPLRPLEFAEADEDDALEDWLRALGGIVDWARPSRM